MKSIGTMYNRVKPYLIVTLLQFGYAGMGIISKFALNKGMSPHVFTVYRHVVASVAIAPFAIFLDRKVRPKMTLSTFGKISLLGLLKPAIEINLFYAGMKYTTATFATAMTNVIPVLVFCMALILRLEKVSIGKVRSQAKILGTIVTIVGAMVTTLVKGPMLDLPWTKANYNNQETGSSNMQHPIKGALMIAISCLCASSFIILQAITMKSYPAEISLTALICLTGTIEGTAVALVLERGNPAAWSILLDSKLLAAVYCGIVSSGFGYYVQGAIMKERGPVFVTAFNPLSMVIVAIMGSFFLAEIMHLGRIIGAIVIVIGLYLVLWGKSKDQTLSSSEGSNKAETSSDYQMVKMNGGVVGTLSKDIDEEATAGQGEQSVKTSESMNQSKAKN